jgi:integrase
MYRVASLRDAPPPVLVQELVAHPAAVALDHPRPSLGSGTRVHQLRHTFACRWLEAGGPWPLAEAQATEGRMGTKVGTS